jgi:hypothetical protein
MAGRELGGSGAGDCGGDRKNIENDDEPGQHNFSSIQASIFTSALAEEPETVV